MNAVSVITMAHFKTVGLVIGNIVREIPKLPFGKNVTDQDEREFYIRWMNDDELTIDIFNPSKETMQHLEALKEKGIVDIYALPPDYYE